MQIVDLQYAPGIINPVVNASQFDVGRPIKLRIFDGATPYSMPSGTTARIDGLKPDGHGFSLSEGVSVSGNEVTFYTKQQMTVVAGKVLCEIRFINGSNTIGTLNFYMDVEPSPINENTDTSDTPLPDIIDLAERHMLAAEGYALGKQNGVDVGSSSPYYHQNSKYYKEQAAGSATTASTKASEASNSASNANTNALKSEGYAVGKQNGTSVSSSSPYYHNNAEYYAQQADASADRAAAYSVNVPYIGANGNWWVWNTTTGAYVDSGVDASITVNIADITMLEPTETPYVTNTGTNTDPIFHLFIPRGKGIASISKTSTSGLVDTYTITYSDGATTTFTVTNGKTAYQSAVDGGYDGTEAQFEADLANFKVWKEDAEDAATAAANSADDAADSATEAEQSYQDAKSEADRAQMYADFLEPHFVIVDNRLCIADDAVGEFIVADNRLCMKFIA